MAVVAAAVVFGTFRATRAAFSFVCRRYSRSKTVSLEAAGDVTLALEAAVVEVVELVVVVVVVVVSVVVGVVAMTVEGGVAVAGGVAAASGVAGLLLLVGRVTVLSWGANVQFSFANSWRRCSNRLSRSCNRNIDR